jgi:multidrug resistance efflux pump
VEVGVELGSYVRQGQLIVRLDSNDSRIRLDQTLAQLEQAKAAVRQAEEKINLRPGQNFDPTQVADVNAARVSRRALCACGRDERGDAGGGRAT